MAVLMESIVLEMEGPNIVLSEYAAAAANPTPSRMLVYEYPGTAVVTGGVPCT